MIKTTLIDADIVTFQAAAGNETTLVWGPDCESTVLEPDLALFRCRERIADIQKMVGSAEVLLCFSGAANFRYDALKTYKHNRKGKRKPQLLGPLKALLWDLYPCRQENRIEADDLMGVLQTPETAIATIDKDLDQIAGLHYNWKHNKVYEVSPKDALWFRWFQVLTGDSTDGYKGIPRVGPVKATKMLTEHRDDKMSLDDQHQEYAYACWGFYQDAGISRKSYEAQVAVAQILTVAMWDDENKSVLTEYQVY